MRIVILEQPHKVDITRLEQQAEVTFLFGREKPRTSVMRCDVFMRAVVERMKEINFDPEEDLLALLPPVLPTSLMLAAATSLHPKINVVIFNAVTSSYETRTLDLENLRA